MPSGYFGKDAERSTGSEAFFEIPRPRDSVTFLLVFFSAFARGVCSFVFRVIFAALLQISGVYADAVKCQGLTD